MTSEPPVTAAPTQPLRPFHILIKPTGAVCNLACQYCFFLHKEELYPGSPFRMSDETQTAYLEQLVQAHPGPVIDLAWQGGEPTLMGLDFFRRSVAILDQITPAGKSIRHSMQTNGVLLDDDWCAFLRQNNFLIGLSVDGPRHLHDAYRVNKGGRGTFDKVMAALALLQRHGVDYNILTTVHAANAPWPQQVYRFLRDDIGTTFIQFIPIVNRTRGTDASEAANVTPLVAEESVSPAQYGDFLSRVFDEWVRQDVGRVFIQMVDVTLGAWLGQRSPVCIFAPTCGSALAVMHNGDLYSCDHFVDPPYHLGNVNHDQLAELVASPAQRRFGEHKRDSLTAQCRRCEVRFVCNGGCPKDRFVLSADGEPGHNYLCEGYFKFFSHAARPMQLMASLLREGRPAGDIMPILAAERAAADEFFGTPDDDWSSGKPLV